MVLTAVLLVSMVGAASAQPEHNSIPWDLDSEGIILVASPDIYRMERCGGPGDDGQSRTVTMDREAMQSGEQMRQHNAMLASQQKNGLGE